MTVSIKYWETSAVSTTDGWLKFNFASCVIRQTRSLGGLCYVPIEIWCSVNYIYDMVVDTQFRKFHGRPFARVLYLFLMKGVGRWLPWVRPGSTGRFYKDDVVHKTFCARILYNPHGGRGKICMILLLLHAKRNTTKKCTLILNTIVPYIFWHWVLVP